jgi:protein-S-isoprenylcysteine O-methyltransferase Ste14
LIEKWLTSVGCCQQPWQTNDAAAMNIIKHPWAALFFVGFVIYTAIRARYALMPFTLLYLIRTRRQEQMMCTTFGDEYRAYMRRTGRLIPRL